MPRPTLPLMWWRRLIQRCACCASAANLGFAGGNNLGAAQSQGDVILVLNPDVRLQPGAVAAVAAAFAADEQIGVAGAKLLFPDGQTIQHAGGLLDYPLATAHHRGYNERGGSRYSEQADVPFVTGAALAIRRGLWQQLGGFDASFFPVYYEDVDLCFRARAAGWRVVYEPSITGLHRSSASLEPGSDTYFRYYHANRLRFVLKHFAAQYILTDFLAAEGARLRGEMPAADRVATRDAYRRLGGDTMGTIGNPYDFDDLARDLNSRAILHEQPFASPTPLVGPLIAAFRSAWNNVATRWYVQPLLQQQIEFNQATAQAVAALARAVDAQQTVTQAAAALAGQKIAALEERLAALEQQAVEGRD